VTRALYGEPVAFWYATSLKTTANANGEIVVRFNPVASYSVAVDEATLFAASGKSGISADIDEGNANEDGVAEFTRDDGDYDALYKTLADKRADKDDSSATLDVYGGKGSSTELFVADGNVFVVVKNTYVDHVIQAYNATYGLVLELESETEIDARTTAEWATLAGVARNSVVLFNIYGEVADYTTIHAATSKTVTLTNSYVEEEGDTIDQCENSYFLVSKDKYEYDCKTLDSFLAEEEDNHLLLDRNLLLAEGNGCETQVVYFDDYGYVIWSTDVPSSTTTGYMIVTSTAYGGYDKDNGYYMNITGYDIKGNAVTVKGGFEQFVYATKDEASDYAAEIGIYAYTVDPDLNLYSLEAAGDDGDADEQVLAGDPDAVSADAISDSNTVFVIANYSTKGAITGYTVKTGIKNIPDLKDADLGSKSTVIYEDYIDYGAAYVDNDYVAGGADGIIDLVLVLGAKQSSDVKYTAKDAAIDDVFYLLNTTPEKQFDEYNLYSVIMDGKATTLKVDVNAEGEAAGTYTSIFDDEGFYKITAWTGDYAFSVEPVDGGVVEKVGADVLSYGGDADSLWAYASCHEGNGEDNNGYIVLADNCKIYNLTDGEVAPIDIDDLAMDAELMVNGLKYASTNAVVADWDAYGFATLIYVVNAD
jgi:hypothetical protein